MGEARQSGSERAKKKKKKRNKKKGKGKCEGTNKQTNKQTNKRTSRGPNVREEGGALKRKKTSDSLLRLDRVGS